MNRIFRQHHVRETESLNGLWDFQLESPEPARSIPPKRYDRTIFVPSCWEMIPGLENYRGKAWLRREICAPGGKSLRLIFGGVSHTGTVLIDGHKVGSHYDAFTPWDLLVPSLPEGGHQLVVEVDNSFGDHSALHKENDYYTYGGITRPVEAQYLPEVFLERVHATPRLLRGKWLLDVKATVRNLSTTQEERALSFAVAGTKEQTKPFVIGPGKSKSVELTLKPKTVKPWSAESPQLYFLNTVLLENGQPVDDLIERVGFREVKVRGKKLLLNGESIRLRGFNRHEDHPQFGCAIPTEAMMADLELIRDMGCNFVRTCHYPNDMRFLDLCDELGIYVWEESHARQVSFDHPKFREQIEVSTREMIDWHYNHPSIIIWASLNECVSDTAAGRKEHERVLRQIKKLDPTRPCTFASNRHERDKCFDLVDIVSINTYDAWYSGGPERVSPRLKELLKWIHSEKSKGGKGKPVILSEFGAGAIYGNRQRCESKWSEEYADKALDECLRVYLNDPQVVGAAIWQFSDVRITEAMWNRRPRTMNNKGVVDEYRRPKLAYASVKKRMIESRKKWDGKK